MFIYIRRLLIQQYLPKQNSLELLFKSCKAEPRFHEVRRKGIPRGGAGDGERPRAERRGQTSWNAKFTRRCGPKFQSSRNGCDWDAMFDEVARSETVWTTEDEHAQFERDPRSSIEPMESIPDQSRDVTPVLQLQDQTSGSPHNTVQTTQQSSRDAPQQTVAVV